MSGTRRSLMATRRKTAVFHSFFPHVSEVAQSDFRRRDSTALFQGLIVFVSIHPWLKHEIFTVSLMSLRTWRSEPFRVITQRYTSLFRRSTKRGHQSKRIPSWMSKHPMLLSAAAARRPRFLLIRLVRSQNLKLFLNRLRGRRSVNSHEKRLTVSERSSYLLLVLCVFFFFSTSWDTHAML